MDGGWGHSFTLWFVSGEDRDFAQEADIIFDKLEGASGNVSVSPTLHCGAC